MYGDREFMDSIRFKECAQGRIAGIAVMFAVGFGAAPARADVESRVSAYGSKVTRTRSGELAGIASAIHQEMPSGMFGGDEAQKGLYDPGELHQAKLLPEAPHEVAPTHMPLPGAWPLAVLGGILVARLRKHFA